MTQPAGVVPVTSTDTCGVCGARLPAHADVCGVCGCVVGSPSLPVFDTAGLWRRLVLAPSWVTACVYAVDFLVLLVVAAGLGVAMGALTTHFLGYQEVRWLVVGAAVGAAGALWATLAAYGRWGRAVTGWLFGVRLVDRSWLLPVLPFGFVGAHRHPCSVVRVRGRVDPLAASVPTWTGIGAADRLVQRVDGDRAALRRRGVPADSVVLAFESGQVHWFTGSCVIGRSPTSSGDTLGLPDLSRKLSSNHVTLRQVEGSATGVLVVAEDQGSATGTWLEHDGGRHRLLPGQHLDVHDGDSLTLGDYRFRVERGTG